MRSEEEIRERIQKLREQLYAQFRHETAPFWSAYVAYIKALEWVLGGG